MRYLLPVFIFLSLVSVNSYASWDGNVSLRSNKNAKYYLDEIHVGTGKVVAVHVNPGQSHKLVAKVEGFKDKVEYIQANYPRKKLGFIFLSDDKIKIKKPLVDLASVQKGRPYLINDESVQRVDIGPVAQGKYRALIIANNQYISPSNAWNSLSTPVTDATALKNILETHYGFVETIFIKDATRRDVYQGFKKLLRAVQQNDNVLVFYAGHGYFDNDDIKTGYWIPTDAESDDESTFVSNEDIKKRLAILSRKAGHVLMVSDSCFSGNFLNRGMQLKNKAVTDRYYSTKNRLKSTQIITSGGNEYVDDQYSDSGHSPFAYFLLRKLKNNDKKFLSTTELSLHLEKSVTNAAGQSPTHGSLKSAEDEGGEFFFIRNN